MHKLHNKKVRPQPYDFMADMFSPIIVWDTSRREIAEKMVGSERRVIAKRATLILRDNLPEIMDSFSSYDAARSGYADATVLSMVEQAGLMDNKESVKTKRKLTESEKILGDIDDWTQRYCAQAGYRAACLNFLLGGEEQRVESDRAFEGLQKLHETQQTLFQSLLLQDLLRLTRKYMHTYPTFEFEQLTESYIGKFRRRISLMRGTLESMGETIGGITVTQFMDNMRARNPVFTDGSLNDPILGLTCEFEVIRECYERLNEQLSAVIATSIDSMEFHNEDWSVRVFDD